MLGFGSAATSRSKFNSARSGSADAAQARPRCGKIFTSARRCQSSTYSRRLAASAPRQVLHAFAGNLFENRIDLFADEFLAGNPPFGAGAASAQLENVLQAL